MTSPVPSPENEGPRPSWRLRLLHGGCRYGLATLFLLAGASKVSDLSAFANRMELHSGLPPTLGRSVGLFVPWLELTCGLCLVIGWAVRETAALLTLLLIGFLAYALLHPEATDCGCLLLPKVLSPLATGIGQVLRNLGLLAAAAWLAFRPLPVYPS